MLRSCDVVSGIVVGGLQPLTTIDFPGELAAVVFCQGCPWRCGYCHNVELLSRKKAAAYRWSQVTDFLARRVGLLDAVVFSGGEPTLQRDLIDAVIEVKEMGFKVGLHSAGCYPRRLHDLLPHLDWIGLDIKALAENYSDLTGVAGSGDRAWESLALLLDDQGTDYEVRVTVERDLLESGNLSILVARLADMGVENLALQGCRHQGMECSEQRLRRWLEQAATLSDRFNSIILRHE